MKTVARMITRPVDDGSDAPNLGLVAFFHGQSALKANRVYEIREVLGELVVVDIGENVLVGKTEAERKGMPCWGQDVSTILNQGGRNLYLTKAEYASICKDEG